jgi:hypothetical protein
MNPLTLQEIFNKGAAHLLRQGVQSLADSGDSGSECLYRGPNGVMCGAGPFIPDAQYTEALEGIAVPVDGAALDEDQQALVRAFEHGGIQGSQAFGLLRRIQGVHDSRMPGAWREALRILAMDYKLDAGVLDTVVPGNKS